MATIRRELVVQARPESVWDAIRDVGALHTRLVRGFVTDTRLEGNARIVTFANGVVARELIVTTDDDSRRFVWAVVESPLLKHYNASVQVFEEGSGSRIVWTADLLPDEAAGQITQMIELGLQAMKRTLDG